MNPQNHILVVDADRCLLDTLALILDDFGAVRCATGSIDAIRSMTHALPDVILLDAAMDDGVPFRATLRADARFATVPVILMVDRVACDIDLTTIDDTIDLVDKPIAPALLRTRVRMQLRMKSLVDALAAQARSDVLTGLANRREFDAVLEREWHRGERGGDALSVLMVDIDRFDAFNDRYGRPAGDRCLVAVARALAALALRRGDLVARYSDEKLVFVLPQTPRHGADFMAAQILATIDELAIAHDGSPTGRLTVSVGASSYDTQSACWVAPRANADFARHHARARIVGELVQAADRALGVAKFAGRARARALDVADLDEPTKIRDVVPGSLRRSIAARLGHREAMAFA